MKKRNNYKHIRFTIFVAVVISLFAILAIGAAADDSASTAQAVWGTDESHLTASGTLAEAVAAASADRSITYIRLTSDITGEKDKKIVIKDGQFTLDLNGHTVVAEESTWYFFSISGISHVTIVDTGENQNGTVKATKQPFNLSGDAFLEIQSGNFVSESTHPVIGLYPGASPTLVISGGKYESGGEGISHSSGILKIAGGEFNTARAEVYLNSGVSLNFSDHPNPNGIRVYYYSTDGAALPWKYTGDISLPDGYFLYDTNEVPASILGSGNTYTITLPGTPPAIEVTWSTPNLGRYEGSLNDAILWAAHQKYSGVIAKLEKDIENSSGYTINDGDLTIDLNGHTISSDSSTAFTIQGKAKVIITDTSAAKSGEIKTFSENNYNVLLIDNSHLTINGGSFKSIITNISSDDGGHSTNSELIINGGSLTSEKTYAIFANGKSVTINGGNFSTSGVCANIMYASGSLDFSANPSPEDITLQLNYLLVSPNIKMPEMHEFVDSNGNVATSLSKSQIYTIKNLCAHRTYDANGLCSICRECEPAELIDGVYQIKNAGNLIWLDENATEAIKMLLVADIDLSDIDWTPLSLPEYSFFDGNGHTITMAISVSDATTSNYGLFHTFNYGVIKDLTLKGTLSVNSEGCVGALVGSAYRTTISGVVSYVDVTNLSTGKTGGLAGQFGGQHSGEALSLIENCAVYANVCGGHTGGIIGYGWAGWQYYDIKNVIYAGEVTSNNLDVYRKGAIIGYHGNNQTATACTFENIYFYELGGASFSGGGNTNYTLGNNVSTVNALQLESGEIAYILGSAWGQTVEEDLYPVLGGAVVYRSVAGGCNEESYTYRYTNSKEEDTPSHSFETVENVCDFCQKEFFDFWGELFEIKGNVTNTGLLFGPSTELGGYKAGDGYVLLVSESNIILHGATVDLRGTEGGSALISSYVQNDNTSISFYGVNNLYPADGYAVIDFINNYNSHLISGADGATLNLHGYFSGDHLRFNGGTVNILGSCDTGYTLDTLSITVDSNTVVTVTGLSSTDGPSLICDLVSGDITVHGTLNAIVISNDTGVSESLNYVVMGDVIAGRDIINYIGMDPSYDGNVGLIIPEGASLTIPEKCTLDLDSFDLVEVNGKIFAEGTLICTHAGGKANCSYGAICDICKTHYGDLDPDNHVEYSASVTAPDCKNSGYTTYTCLCGHSYTGDEVDALGHEYGEFVVGPFCASGGYTIYTCKVCGYSYRGGETDAKGHDWIEATYDTPKTCSVCGESEGEPIENPEISSETDFATETQTEIITEENSDAVTESESTTKTETETETETDTYAESESTTKTETETETETDTYVESEINTELESVAETEKEIVLENDTNIETESETNTHLDSVIETESETETTSEVESEINTKLESAIETETKTEVITETVSEVNTEAPAESDTMPSNIEIPSNSSTDNDKKNGCGSSIGIGFIGLISIVGVTLSFKKKKKQTA